MMSENAELQPLSPLSSPPPPPPPGAAGPGKRRGCLKGCLTVLAVPVGLLLALLIWASVGPAPSPADCLPPGAPVRLAARDPLDVLDLPAHDPRLANMIRDMQILQGGDPSSSAKKPPLFLARRLFGSEIAVAFDGADNEGPILLAFRPTLSARAGEKIFRIFTKDAGDGVRLVKGLDRYYGNIGKTFVFSKHREEVAAVLARREEILSGENSVAPSGDVRAELRLKTEVRAEAGAGGFLQALTLLGPPDEAEKNLRALADSAVFPLDLPRPADIDFRIALDRDLSGLNVEIKAASGVKAPPPLPAAGPRSAKLVPADALGYWVWQAPAGAKRWGPLDRLAAADAAGDPWSGYLDLLDGVRLPGGTMPSESLARQLNGERAVYLAGQPGPDGKPLVAAATLMFEAPDPAAVWPTVRKVLESVYPVSTDGRPPGGGGGAAQCFLAPGSYRGVEYLEEVRLYKLHGSGYAAAFAVVGDFLVLTTSQLELKRIIDRHLGAGAEKSTLAGSKALAVRVGAPGGARPVALMVLRPQGRGAEIADLVLAVRGLNVNNPPGQKDIESFAALGRLLSEVESFRAEWLPNEKGGLTLEAELKLRPAAGQ